MEEESDEDAPLAHKWRAKAEKQHTTSECQALVILEQHCEKVAEKVLEKAKIKLRKGAALRGTSAFDRDAYRQGQEDAKQIDIKQRGIDNKPAASAKRGSSKKRSV